MIAKAIGCTSTASLTLDYLHHDKGGAITAERVTWAENVNCIQASAEGTERMWAQLVDDAPEIKRQAGGSTRGRRLENPYAHYVTSWSPDENPSRDEMMTATRDAMDRVGYKGCQYRVVIHSDTDHKHAHAIVCRVHPETGRAMGRKNDGYRLREWALEYEKTQGRIRVPGRLDAHTNRARYMRQKREQPDKKPPRATDAEKTRRRERRHRGVRTRDAIGRPIDLTDSERQEWAALFQSRPTPSEKADLKKAQTERRIIKAERSERAVAATPPTTTMRPSPTLHRDDARVGLDVRPTPPTTTMRPPPTLHRDDARVGLDVRPTPPTTTMRPPPTLHRDDARVGLDVRPTPPTMTMRPSPTLHRDDARVGLDARPTPPTMTMRPSPTLHRDDARVGLDVRPTPPTMTMRPPPKERPAVAQVPRPDQDLAASPTPAPQAADRETKRIAAAAATEATRRFEHVKAHAMRNAEHAAAELAHDRRHDPPTVALYQAAQARVAGSSSSRYTATQEVAGIPLAVGRLRKDFETEILDILADPEPKPRRRARIPPPEPEAVASLVQTVRDLADRRIQNAGKEEGLDLDLSRAEPAPTAAPADEQPAPPASEAPQPDPHPDPSPVVRDEPARQPIQPEPVAGHELHPDRGAGEGAGGTSPARTGVDDSRTGEREESGEGKSRKGVPPR